MSAFAGVPGNVVAAASGRRLPFALTYHGIGDVAPTDDPHGLVTSRESFARHLDLLIACRYRLVGITELYVALARGGRAADGLGAVTFDDGLADSMQLAAELASARGATVTAFLSPGLFGKDHPDLPPGQRILRADEVAQLEHVGVEIGGHSYHHVELPALPRRVQLEELRDSRTALEELVGHPVTTMAYPYGRYDATTIAAAREAGFNVACGNDGSGPWRALELPREPIFPSTSLLRLRLKAAGLHGPVTAARELTRRARTGGR